MLYLTTFIMTGKIKHLSNVYLEPLEARNIFSIWQNIGTPKVIHGQWTAKLTLCIIFFFFFIEIIKI